MMGLYLIFVILCLVTWMTAIKVSGQAITYGDLLLALLVALVPILHIFAILFATTSAVVDVLSKASVQKFFNKKLF